MIYRPTARTTAFRMDNDPIYQMRYDALMEAAEHNGFSKPIPEYKDWLLKLAEAGVSTKISPYRDEAEFQRISSTTFFSGAAPGMMAPSTEASTVQEHHDQQPQELPSSDWADRIAASDRGSHERG